MDTLTLPAHPLSVLVVDDYPDAANTLARVLTLYGHAARAAFSGEQALQLAETFAPDVVLLDIGLPGMDGYALVERLCDLLERRPLMVAVTGYGTERDEQRCRQAGFDHHFLKPVDATTLDKLLQDHAGQLAGVWTASATPNQAGHLDHSRPAPC
jgi:CheY-like chemotaxis protein